jgi:hypothetical protein
MRSNNRLYWILLILSMAGYAWIGYHFFTAEHDTSITVCLFKNITGIPCPSCGITRALLLLMDGEIRGAVLTNPLGLFAAMALLIIPFWILADLLIQKNTLERSFLWTEKRIKTKKAVYIPLAALALLNWGWNILKEI